MILRSDNLLKKTRQFIFVWLLISVFAGCGDEGYQTSEEVVESVEDIPDEYIDGIEIPTRIIERDEYKVTLDVTKNIEHHKKGDLRVWIGLEMYMPKTGKDMVRDTTTIPSDIGAYAKITPYAPDFEIQPEKSQCIRIHPSGSSVLFTLTPLKRGEFTVRANVELFEKPDCSDTPIPKSSETLTVIVTVDKMEVVHDKLGELLTILWDKFLSFWGVVITLMFGVIIFLIRKYIKKKTGYIENE